MQSTNAVQPLAIYRGQVEDKYGLQTAIDKKPIQGKILLSFNGLEGDECADTEHHGGPERALHQYPMEHYAYWQRKYQKAGDSKQPEWQAPGMGENISTQGMLEDTVYIGDQYQWGDAIIEVSQPRSPCFKLSYRWNIKNFSVDMQEISRCGWLYRVIQPGNVSDQDALILIHRPNNALNIKQTCDLFFTDPLNPVGLEQLKNQQALSMSWKNKVEQRLSQGLIEDWNFRLLGHK